MEPLAGGADHTGGLGSAFEYPRMQKAQARCKLDWCGCGGLLTHAARESLFVLNSTLRWSCCHYRKKKEPLGRNILHLKREFCEPWQSCHSCSCEFLEQGKWLGNTLEGAQSLHSDKNGHHHKDTRMLNSTRANINLKGSPKLGSSEG